MLKRIVAFLLSMLLIVPVASANGTEGVFVPNYKAFMESFTQKVELIDSGLAEAIRKDCYVDNVWGSPSDSINRVWYWKAPYELRLYELSDYLQALYITIDKDKIDENDNIYKELILAAATSIVPNADEEFEQTLFDNLYYDYVKESPAGYITMYWNYGVYLFQFGKASGEYEFKLSLSLYSGN